MAGLKGAGLETQRAILADGFGVEWPIGPDGHPLSFIAAFALDDLPLVDPLPDSGTLLVY